MGTSKKDGLTRRGFLAAGVAGVAGAASVLAGCAGGSGGSGSGSSGSSGGSADGELTSVTFVLDWTPNTNHTGVYVAQAMGYYEEAGLDVEIVQGPDDGADSLVASGEADFGVSFQDTMATYVSGDDVLPVKAVAAICQHNTSGIISLADKGIDSPAGLEGHSYATWELPIEQGILERCVEADGGDYSEVELVPSTVTDEVTALQNDQVDSIWVYWGWAGIKCELEGLDTNYFEFADIDSTFDYYTPLIIASDSIIESDPDTVAAFLEATRRGYEDAIADPEGAAEILLEAAPELDSELVYASQEYLSAQYQADAGSWGVIDAERWDAFFAWVSGEGLVEEEIESGAGLDESFL